MKKSLDDGWVNEITIPATAGNVVFDYPIPESLRADPHMISIWSIVVNITADATVVNRFPAAGIVSRATGLVVESYGSQAVIALASAIINWSPWADVATDGNVIPIVNRPFARYALPGDRIRINPAGVAGDVYSGAIRYAVLGLDAQ